MSCAGVRGHGAFSSMVSSLPRLGEIFSVFHTSTSTDTPYPQQKRQYLILNIGRIKKKKNRQGHSTVVLISYTIQCVENKLAKTEVVDYTERVKGESSTK